jgi:hypothetical protein
LNTLLQSLAGKFGQRDDVHSELRRLTAATAGSTELTEILAALSFPDCHLMDRR